MVTKYDDFFFNDQDTSDRLFNDPLLKSMPNFLNDGTYYGLWIFFKYKVEVPICKH